MLLKTNDNSKFKFWFINTSKCAVLILRGVVVVSYATNQGGQFLIFEIDLQFETHCPKTYLCCA
jgi:hypothetical protein